MPWWMSAFATVAAGDESPTAYVAARGEHEEHLGSVISWEGFSHALPCNLRAFIFEIIISLSAAVADPRSGRCNSL